LLDSKPESIAKIYLCLPLAKEEAKTKKQVLTFQ